MKSSEVSIKTRSNPASLTIQAQVTKDTTVKWSIESRTRQNLITNLTDLNKYRKNWTNQNSKQIYYLVSTHIFYLVSTLTTSNIGFNLFEVSAGSGRAAPGTQVSSAFLEWLDLSAENVKYGIDILKRRLSFKISYWKFKLCDFKAAQVKKFYFKITNAKKVMV